MRYKALISFSSYNFSMAMGETKEIFDSSIADDLLRAGYIVKLDEDEPEKDEPQKEEPKKATNFKTTTKRKEKKS